MNINTRFNKLTALTLLTSLASPTVLAHPGHVADQSLHSLLHIEHVLVLATAAVVSLAVYASRKK